MNSNLEAATRRFAGATKLLAKKHGPAILTGCGIAGFLATNVLTARAAVRVQEPVKVYKLKLARWKDLPDEEQREAMIDIGREACKIGWAFAPAVLAGSASIACLITGHGMMRHRQIALATAYTAIQQAYDAYRERVRKEIGEDRELELYRDVRLLDPAEPGLPCEIDYDDKMPSLYARFFDYHSPNWKKTPEYNLMFVYQQQQWANDRLRAYGHVFLNEVYDALGIKRSQLGQLVGWKMGNGGDDYVTFGIHDIFDDNARAFVNGVEGVILLDFNVDGPIAI